MDRAADWDTVYRTKTDRDVSWFEAAPELSLHMLDAAGVSARPCILDVGGGDSRLVDNLVARGLTCLAVLDISGAALARARTRLGPAASVPTWIESDVTGVWSLAPVDVWHDRAVFHFLTTSEDRASYRTHLHETLKLGGTAVVATFALDGPNRCSGLPVVRYSPDTLAAELGPAFELAEAALHLHTTPWGASQSFQYSRFRRVR